MNTGSCIFKGTEKLSTLYPGMILFTLFLQILNNFENSFEAVVSTFAIWSFLIRITSVLTFLLDGEK